MTMFAGNQLSLRSWRNSLNPPIRHLNFWRKVR
jgi:hypothetical protein